MNMEQEVVVAELRAMGCPYLLATDHLAKAWLEGHMAGRKAALADAERILNEEFTSRLQGLAK